MSTTFELVKILIYTYRFARRPIARVAVIVCGEVPSAGCNLQGGLIPFSNCVAHKNTPTAGDLRACAL
jgi:hypothetical protein